MFNSLKKIYSVQKFLLLIGTLVFLMIFSGNAFAASDEAPGSTTDTPYLDLLETKSGEWSESSTGQTSDTNTNTNTQKDNFIRIREPLPGQSNVIDVSGDKGSIDILADYVSGIFRFVAALSVIIAVIVLMAAGFKIMVAGGDTSARDDAKEWIQKVFMGLAFLFLSGLFLKTINPHFYVFGGGNQSGAGEASTAASSEDLNGGYTTTTEEDIESGWYE